MKATDPTGVPAAVLVELSSLVASPDRAGTRAQVARWIAAQAGPHCPSSGDDPRAAAESLLTDVTGVDAVQHPVAAGFRATRLWVRAHTMITDLPFCACPLERSGGRHLANCCVT